MSNKAINVDEDSKEFQLELERRIKLAKNPKNRISISQSKKDIPKKYSEIASVKAYHQLTLT